MSGSVRVTLADVAIVVEALPPSFSSARRTIDHGFSAGSGPSTVNRRPFRRTTKSIDPPPPGSGTATAASVRLAGSNSRRVTPDG